jgi:hypothetical protein
MPDSPFAPLTEEQIKTAFLGNLMGGLIRGGARAAVGLGKGLANFGLNAGRGLVGLGPMQGAGLLGRGVAGAGSAVGSAVNATARNAGSGALNMARGAIGLGAREGAGLAGKTMAGLGAAGMAAMPIGMAMSSGQNGPQFSVLGQDVLGGGRTVTGSEEPSPLLVNAARKLAELSAADLADVASYGAFMGGKLVDPVKHPILHNALDAAGLVGLGATTAHSMLSNRAERKPGLKDLVGLALMGSALYDRAHNH